MSLLNAVSVLQSFKKEKISPLVAKSATKGFFAIFAKHLLLFEAKNTRRRYLCPIFAALPKK